MEGGEHAGRPAWHGEGWSYWRGECSEGPKVTEIPEKRGWPQDAGCSGQSGDRGERREDEGQNKVITQVCISSLEYLAKKA